MSSTVLFHQFPPVITQPDIALTILKGYLRSHHVPTETVYWNFLLRRFYDRFVGLRPDIHLQLRDNQELRESLFALGPFLLHLLKNENTDGAAQAQASLRSYYASLFPATAVQHPTYLDDHVEQLRADVVDFVEQRIAQLDLSQILLWAISCKSSQWIPGLIATRFARTRRSDLPIVLGGFATAEEASTLMRIFVDADFAIWGEGEEPLLGLVNQLQSGERDFSRIPRLISRHDGHLQVSRFLDEQSATLARDDFSDFFATIASLEGAVPPVTQVSLNTIRGCPWSRCRFCTLHQNLSRRCKPPAMVIDEIRDLASQYGVKRIHFANQDIQGPDPLSFDEVLDGLMTLRIEEGFDLEYTGDVAGARVTKQMLGKMALVGFDFLLVGFEAMTDRLLEKVDKQHRFAHNILFLKLTHKFKLKSGANILMNAPDETREDILESIANLHYLRFYPPGTRGVVWVVPMYLGAGAPYTTTLSPAELARWNIDDPTSVYGYLPEWIKAAGDRMHLGYFRAPLANPDLWDRFHMLLDSYQSARREYAWYRHQGAWILHERHEGSLVKDITFEPYHVELLRLANDCVVDLDQLAQGMKRTFPEIDEARVRDIVRELRSEYLLYADEDLRTIISIVDTDSLPME